MEYALQLENLTKIYGKETAVDNFSLSIEKGHIYGLIGQNGAGKTTIMKIIAGLCLQDRGDIKIFGNSRNLNEHRGRMSFMLESPYLDGGMTAYDNLQYIRYVRGIAGEERIGEVLETVGLADTGKKKVRGFSLGMRQRLGIGMALLSNPEIMVLDEPVNGLDPEGIVDIRNILKRLCEERGVTILISSHLLSELSELCTDFVIINKGKLVEELSEEELKVRCRNHLAIKTDKIEQTAAVLEKCLDIKEYKVVHGEEIQLYERLDDIELVSKTITDNDIVITKFVIEGENLEEYYLSKVGGSNE